MRVLYIPTEDDGNKEKLSRLTKAGKLLNLDNKELF